MFSQEKNRGSALARSNEGVIISQRRSIDPHQQRIVMRAKPQRTPIKGESVAWMDRPECADEVEAMRSDYDERVKS